METDDSLIFSVKGDLHPPNAIVADLKYVPALRGARKRGGKHYRKIVSLPEKTAVLKKRWPHYLKFDPVFNQVLQEVPVEKIVTRYDPIERASEILRPRRSVGVERDAAEFLHYLKEVAGLDAASIGLSGSILLGLQTKASDIDPMIYGVQPSRRAYGALKRSFSESHMIKPYSRKQLLKLYDLRNAKSYMALRCFLKHESRKCLQGTFKRRGFSIRCLRGWSEVNEQYGEQKYRPLGQVTISCVITDDSENILTPCRYPVTDVRIIKGSSHIMPHEIVSFRQRFCEQAFSGERVMATGTLEEVQTGGASSCRIVVGANEEDYIKLAEFGE